MEIVVSNPLHRQYLPLPPILNELYREVWIARHTFLALADKEETAAFRVIWMAWRGYNIVALVFSSSTGQWQAGHRIAGAIRLTAC
jgi:hypothetical protein